MGPSKARWIWGDIDRGRGEGVNGFGEGTLDMGDIDRGYDEGVNGFDEGTLNMG
jgi:hypothetical protein